MPAVAGITLRISVTVVRLLTHIIVPADVLVRLELVSLFLVTPGAGHEGRKPGQLRVIPFFVL